MRVLVVDPPAYTPPYDDALCAALARRGGVQVELVTARFLHGAVPPAEGYVRCETFGPPASRLLERRPRSPLRAPLKLAGHLAGLAALTARARRERPDVVHWQWAPAPALDLRAIRAVGRAAGATVFTAHDVLPRRSASRVRLWWDLYRACDRVIVHSRRGRERLVREVGVDPARIAVVPHGLFDRVARLMPPRRDDPSAPRILFFGLLRPDKGLDVLLEALPLVARRVPGVRLEIAGDARMPLAPLHARAQALGVERLIDWDVRFVGDEDAAAAFARASAIALPYRAIEGSGVLATALACDVPPVTTDVGGFPEILAEWGLGDPVPPGDAPALADALVRALCDEAFRERARAGMARARAALSWDAVAEQTEAVYRAALG